MLEESNETFRKNLLFFLLLTFPFTVLSCHVRPTPDQIYGADYGPHPSDYEAIIKEYYSSYLFDPYSAVYTFRMPTKAWRSQFSQVQYGWAVCGTINAKNRFGGYVGAKPFYVMIHYGKVIIQFDDFMAEVACKQTY